MTGFRYNHDLLLSDADQAAAQQAFPDIFPALDHKDLRDRFAAVDDVANGMKTSSRRLGTFSIFLVAAALIGASTAHLTEGMHGARALAALSTVAGLAGALIGGFGVMHSSRKKRWLLHRFASERLRQFFFQTHVVFAPEIVRAAASGDWSRFREMRAAAFSQVTQMLDTELEARYALTLQDGREDPGGPDRWLVRNFASPGTAVVDKPQAEQLKEAYRALRLNGQRTFAQHKLRETGEWFKGQPADQLRVFTAAAGGAILLSVALHLLVAGSVFGGWRGPSVSWLHLAAIWTAVFALAVRTLDEGLRPGAEVERCRAYRDAITNILSRFDDARSIASALNSMRAMEEVSCDEMVAFLRANEKARFAM